MNKTHARCIRLSYKKKKKKLYIIVLGEHFLNYFTCSFISNASVECGIKANNSFLCRIITLQNARLERLFYWSLRDFYVLLSNGLCTPNLHDVSDIPYVFYHAPSNLDQESICRFLIDLDRILFITAEGKKRTS